MNIKQLREYKMQNNIPKINKTYNCFDDGKIYEGRLYTVDVKEVIPFNDIDEQTLKEWNFVVKQSYWLFSTETDYFVKTENGEDGNATFVRTIDGGWFSIGNFFNSGRLDVDGSLSKNMN